MHKHTFALVSNFSLMVGVQEMLRTVSPPSGMIPCDGTIWIIDKRLWSQTYNQKFVEMWHYPLKLSFQNFHSLLLHHYIERWPIDTGLEMIWIDFQTADKHFEVQQGFAPLTHKQNFQQWHLPIQTGQWSRFETLKNLQKSEMYLLERCQNSIYYFDSLPLPWS